MVVALMVINFADKQVLGLAAGPIQKEFGLSATAYGTIASSFYLLFSLSALIMGFVANRARTTWMLAALAMLWSLTSLPVLLVGSVPALYLSRIALGAAEGPTMPLAVHAVHKWFPEKSRSVPTALTQMGGALGLVIAAPTLVSVIDHQGWRSAFGVLAIVGLLWTIAWAFIGREGPLRSYSAAQFGTLDAVAVAEPRRPYRRLLLNGTWLGGVVASIGVYWALAMNVAWLPEYLEKVLGYSPAAAGRLVVLPSLGSAVAMLVVPWLSGRWIRHGVTTRLARGVIGGLAVLAGGLGVLVFAYAGSRGSVALLALIFGLPTAVFPLFYLVSAQISPVRQRGAVLAIGTAVVTFAGVLAPVATGKIIDAAPSFAQGFQTAFTACAVLMIVGGLVATLAINPERDARRIGLTD
jgi:MFS family permease